MIRNVVTGRLREIDGDEARHADLVRLEEGLALIAGLRFPGLIATHLGRDLGLRENSWDFAITNDWADVEAYRVYDADPEHNRIRREFFGAVCAEVIRVQIDVPDRADGVTGGGER